MHPRKKCIHIILLALLFPYGLIGQIEICDNGIDDDNDRKIDLNDEDCICEIIPPLSLIPNPSFEDLNCCPDNFNQLDCASNWVQASEPTTDFFHTCNFLGSTIFPLPQPFPDGEGIIGFRDGKLNRNGSNVPQPFWKEYAGACLISPLLKDSTYRFQFDVGFIDPRKSPPIDITFFGTADCDYLPFGIGDANFGCPSNSPNWIKLGETRVSGGDGNTWVNALIDVTVMLDIYAIAIGPACSAVSTDTDLYYFFDNLFLADLASFELQVSPSFHPCQSDFFISVPFNLDFEYQWYLDGVALVGEVFPELPPIYGEGNYQVRIIKESDCRVSAPYNYLKPTYNTTESISICSGDTLAITNQYITSSGFYVDSLKARDQCDSVVLLEIEVIDIEYETINVAILEGETYDYEGQQYSLPGEYDLVQTSPSGCDKIITINLTTFNVFIPNVFSPNGDGANDSFFPLSRSGTIQSIDMKIFDRWGNLIFRGSEWKGSNSNPGVYVYLINIEFSNGSSKIFSGSISLLR